MLTVGSVFCDISGGGTGVDAGEAAASRAHGSWDIRCFRLHRRGGCVIAAVEWCVTEVPEVDAA